MSDFEKAQAEEMIRQTNRALNRELKRMILVGIRETALLLDKLPTESDIHSFLTGQCGISTDLYQTFSKSGFFGMLAQVNTPVSSERLFILLNFMVRDGLIELSVAEDVRYRVTKVGYSFIMNG